MTETNKVELINALTNLLHNPNISVELKETTESKLKDLIKSVKK